jgi:hypothetical protein
MPAFVIEIPRQLWGMVFRIGCKKGQIIHALAEKLSVYRVCQRKKGPRWDGEDD